MRCSCQGCRPCAFSKAAFAYPGLMTNVEIAPRTNLLGTPISVALERNGRAQNPLPDIWNRVHQANGARNGHQHATQQQQKAAKTGFRARRPQSADPTASRVVTNMKPSALTAACNSAIREKSNHAAPFASAWGSTRHRQPADQDQHMIRSGSEQISYPDSPGKAAASKERILSVLPGSGSFLLLMQGQAAPFCSVEWAGRVAWKAIGQEGFKVPPCPPGQARRSCRGVPGLVHPLAPASRKDPESLRQRKMPGRAGRPQIMRLSPRTAPVSPQRIRSPDAPPAPPQVSRP